MSNEIQDPSSLLASSAKRLTKKDQIHDSFPIFDWLRFILASVVALSHEEVILWGPAGNFAVQIFFALSGWLIGGILLRTSPSNLPKFYYNRATRIWIPYFIAVATIYILAALREPITATTFRFLLNDITFTHNWFIEKVPSVIETMPLNGTGSHFWSISVEEQFYLAAPLLILFLPRGRSVSIWVLIASASVASASWYGSISLGVLAAVARSKLGDWHLKRGSTLLIAAGAVAAMTAIISCPSTYPILGPLVSIAIVLLTSRPGRRTAVGEFLGGVSYPLYLYHWVGAFSVHWMQKRVPLVAPGFVSYLIASIAGIAAYLIVDRNVLLKRAQFYDSGTGLGVTVTAYSLLLIGLIVGILLN